MNLSEFFHMGGYAMYIWPAYAIAVLVLSINVIQPLLEKRKLLKTIGQKLRRARNNP